MFHMLHVEYGKKTTPQTLIFYTLAKYTVFLSFRHGFASTEEKSTFHHQQKYDAKTAFVSLRKALWKSAWQKNPPSTRFW